MAAIDDFKELTPAESGRLDQIQERVNRFMDKLRASPAYDFETDNPEANTLRRALDAKIMLFAKGGLEIAGVEAATRLFVKACMVRVSPRLDNRARSATPPPSHYTRGGGRREPPEDLPKASGQVITPEWREAKALRTVPKNDAMRIDGFDRGQLVYVRLCPPNYGAMLGRKDGKVYVNVYNPANAGQTTLEEGLADGILSIGDVCDQRKIESLYVATFYATVKKSDRQKKK